MLNQVNASQNSLQTIGNTHNGFQPLSSIIMTERFDNSLKINLAIISGKRVKKCQVRQHKIKQTKYWSVFKETIKVKDKKDKVELKT